MTLEKVIPRLLEPLQSDGRSIKPCLIHGDLEVENSATDITTGEPFVFNAGSFYGNDLLLLPSSLADSQCART